MSIESANSVSLLKDGPIAIITIDRPKVRNALDLAAARLISDCVDEIERDPGIRVGIITGAGHSAFCTGLDMQARARGEPRPTIPPYGFGGFVRRTRTKPFIAAVNGSAVGGGLEIAMACELIVATPAAHFSLPETLRGLIAGGDCLPIAFSRLPKALAWEIALTGRQLTATEALRFGMINRIDDDVMSAAKALAHEVLGGAPQAIGGTLRLAQQLLVSIPAHYDELTAKTQDHLFQTNDAKEGARAFLEKRKPVWTNS